MIMYESYDEVFVMAPEKEKEFKKQYFTKTSGRDITDFERRENVDFVSVRQNGLRVDTI